jgi:hypothetical protein
MMEGEHDTVHKKRLYVEEQNLDGLACDSWLNTVWWTVLTTYSLEDIFSRTK